jgi:hypothetical protein
MQLGTGADPGAYARMFLLTVCAFALCAQPVHNVKDYGATGRKQDNARPTLQLGLIPVP